MLSIAFRFARKKTLAPFFSFAYAQATQATQAAKVEPVELEKKPKPSKPMKEGKQVIVTPPVPSLPKEFDILKEFIPNFKGSKVNELYLDLSLEKNIMPSLRKFQELGFNKFQLGFLFNKRPIAFLSDTPKAKLTIAELEKYLKTTFSMTDGNVRSVILRHNYIFEFTLPEIQQRMEILRNELQLTDGEVKRVLYIYPIFIQKNLETMLKENLRNLESWLPSLKRRQIGLAYARFPFLIQDPNGRAHENARILLNYGFSEEQIYTILKKFGEAFYQRPGGTRTMLQYVIDEIKVPPKEIPAIFTEHRRLFVQNPSTMLRRKKQLFEHFGIEGDDLMRLFVRHPRVWIKSIGSTDLKLKYLKQRWRMDFKKDPDFPGILNYNYGETIRPRGELLLGMALRPAWREHVLLTDEEFCKKYGFELEELQKLKAEKPFSNELDMILRSWTRFLHNHGRHAKY
eukprot:TRINITY_DN8070_c0_g6_i1.p1 TRINITY_DN8070_c0_g6~~TRINITY_DN8070_c0_g6_i1.p1  ORF type:complete len:457 (+),score=129.00 TRINITY_DN8070_c0_g6_i1:80-1450(+)